MARYASDVDACLFEPANPREHIEMVPSEAVQVTDQQRVEVTGSALTLNDGVDAPGYSISPSGIDQCIDQN